MKYKDIINQMTLEEKAALLSGKDFWQTQEIERLGVPAMFLADGPHGLRKQQAASDHLGLNAGVPATCFPTAATIANSWDVALGEEIGRCLGTEAAAQSVHVLLGPGLNIKRSPLCGRNFEYFSEDPYLSGKMAAAYIRGIQSCGVAACPKHFAANSQEHLRLSSDSVVDERTLREIYLTGFEIAVKESRPQAIMSSYNLLNGTYTNENRELLRDILIDEWGFDGMVVSDWGGSNDRVQGLIAGNHLEMPATGGDSNRQIVAAVKEGLLEEELLDQRVDELLKVLFACVPNPHADVRPDMEKHHAIARKAAGEAIVLLKNEEQILPLRAGTKVAVIGDFAKEPRYQGAGSSLVNPAKLDNTLDRLSESGLVSCGYARGYLRNDASSLPLLQEACRLAKEAEVVLLYMGLDENREKEGIDSTRLDLARNQMEVLQAVYQENKNIVIILSCGSVVEMPWSDMGKAIVHGYLSGQAGAGAILDVLTGKVNPSGKLAETYPVKLEDTPCYAYYPGRERTAEYREGIFVGYRYYDTAGVKVKYPFGYGLSYTTFTYAQLSYTAEEASFVITNTGDRAGAEVAQLYIHARDTGLYVPDKELKGFVKVYLQPGESAAVTIPLDDKAFRFYNSAAGEFIVPAGTYDILIGASSADIRLTGSLEITGKESGIPCQPDELPSYYSGKITKVTDQEFERLLGHPIPPAKWDRNSKLGMNDTVSQLFYARSGLARLVYRVITYLKNKADQKGKPNLNILFIYYSPFRGIGKMTGGMFTMKMVEYLLEIVNGHFFRGVGHLIGERRREARRRKDDRSNKKI